MQDLGLCPCGGKLMASVAGDPLPALAHEPPVCKAFDELDVDDFLTYVRKQRELAGGES